MVSKGFHLQSQSKLQLRVRARAVHGLVTAGGPARALGQASRMVGTANQELAAGLLDEMAFQTQIRVAFGQQLGVDRAMRVVTAGTAFTQGFVFEYKRTLLGRVATQAHVIFGKQ